MLREKFFVNAGPVVETFQMSRGYQLHKVLISGVVPGQQHQMMRAALGAGAVFSAFVGYVDFAAEDGFDARFFTLGIKLYRTVEGAVVGDRQGIHSQIFGLSHQFRDPADTVQHAVLGMDVQVGERRHGQVSGCRWDLGGGTIHSPLSTTCGRMTRL